jgi:UDP-N-acetylmuramate dehydrogenase
MAMSVLPAARKRLAAIPALTVLSDVPLAAYTRFGIGGPAAVFCSTPDEGAFVEALGLAASFAAPRLVIGGGTNLIVSDAGFEGIVLRFTGCAISRHDDCLHAQAGAPLQRVVDESIALGLKGMETMTGIPGDLGGAVYGNAGAYGRSIHQTLQRARVTDGARVFALSNARCRFRYRDSIFKERKDWIILSAELRFSPGDPVAMAQTAAGIRSIRDAKYPPSMKCAGSIFKNLLFADLPPYVQREIPEQIVREGKVPSAWFLEQTGVKGLRKGDIQVAGYHANLIYNDGAGTASDLVSVIQELKRRVRERFGFELEEEVQYVGFDFVPVSV